jgi:hypothetical protein
MWCFIASSHVLGVLLPISTRRVDQSRNTCRREGVGPHGGCNLPTSWPPIQGAGAGSFVPADTPPPSNNDVPKRSKSKVAK